MQHAQERWKEAERTLAQQESFVQDLKEQREKQVSLENNGNAENILTSSIQSAKEKLINFQSKRQNPFYRSSNRQQKQCSRTMMNFSREKKQKCPENGALAGAMKKLQDRISQLEKDNDQYEKQNKLFKIQIESLQSEKKVILSGLEDAKRKNITFENNLKKQSIEITELLKRNEILEKEFKKRISSDQHQKEKKLKQKLSNSEMLYKAKIQELEHKVIQLQSKEKGTLQMQNRNKEQQIKYEQQLALTKSIQRELELKVSSQTEKQKKDKETIENLRRQIQQFEREQAETKMNLDRLGILEEEIQELRVSQKSLRYSSPKNVQQQQKMQILKTELKQIKQKYEQLFYTYKNLDQKCRREEREAKNYRTKFWKLKQLSKQMIDKINSLPNATTSQLKYLIVKINKIEAFTEEYYLSTPIKNKNNLSNRSISRSRSNSKKKKPLKLDDLNDSKNSARSRKSIRSNKSNSKSKKQVIHSQKPLNSQIQQLQHQIQIARKEYKQLVEIIGKEENQDVRNRLNDLAIDMQEKAERMTALKQKR